MLSPSALLRGIVQRALPSINLDNANVDVGVRQFSYGEVCTQPMVRKAHNLADEGSYFVANTAQTGVALANYVTSFTAVDPFIVIFNNNPTGGKNCYLDYIALTASTAGVSTTTAGFTAVGVYVDQGNRLGATAGTVMTVVNPNLYYPANASNVVANAGCNATAASAAVRAIVGQRNVRPALSTTVVNVIGDMNMFVFGGVEGTVNGQISITAGVSNIIPQNFPPVIIPPQCSGLLYIWYPVLSAPSAAAYVPEVGFWVR